MPLPPARRTRCRALPAPACTGGTTKLPEGPSTWIEIPFLHVIVHVVRDHPSGDALHSDGDPLGFARVARDGVRAAEHLAADRQNEGEELTRHEAERRAERVLEEERHGVRRLADDPRDANRPRREERGHARRRVVRPVFGPFVRAPGRERGGALPRDPPRHHRGVPAKLFERFGQRARYERHEKTAYRVVEKCQVTLDTQRFPSPCAGVGARCTTAPFAAIVTAMRIFLGTPKT